MVSSQLSCNGGKKDLKGEPIERELRDLSVDYNAWTLFVSLFKTNSKKTTIRQLEECKYLMILKNYRSLF